MLWLDIVCFIKYRMFHFVKMAASYSVDTQFYIEGDYAFRVAELL